MVSGDEKFSFRLHASRAIRCKHHMRGGRLWRLGEGASMSRQHYTDLNTRPIDWAYLVVMTAASITGALWLIWICEGLLK